MKNLLIIIVSAIYLVGCSGMKFNDSTNAFTAPPPSLSKRSVWHDPSIIEHKLESLCGYFIQKSSGENEFHRIKQILPNQYKLIVEPIPEGVFYHSKVNSEFVTSGEGSIPILSVAASLKKKPDGRNYY